MTEEKQDKKNNKFAQIVELYSQVIEITSRINDMNILPEHTEKKICDLNNELVKSIDNFFEFAQERNQKNGNMHRIPDFNIHSNLLKLKSIIENSDFNLTKRYKYDNAKRMSLQNDLISQRYKVLNNLSKICNGMTSNQNLFFDYSKFEEDANYVLDIFLKELLQNLERRIKEKTPSYSKSKLVNSIATYYFKETINNYVERKIENPFFNAGVKCYVYSECGTILIENEICNMIIATVLEFFNENGISTELV